MELRELLRLYRKHQGVKSLGKMLTDDRKKRMFAEGATASSLPMMFAALCEVSPEALGRPYVFVLDDKEEAGYFYHDLVQILGEEQVLFFPSSFRRAVKYGQRDAGNEILRTEVLGRVQSAVLPLFVVSYPEAMAEMVVSKEQLAERTLTLECGQHVDITEVEKTLAEFGFSRTDYVYEPGQFAVRGSILDIYSYSNENPYRLDFFDDEIDSIRTFEVQTQLSKERQQSIFIVPELGAQTNRESILSFLPQQCIVVLKSITYLCETITAVHEEGFSQQAKIESEATDDNSSLGTPNSELSQVLVDGETFSRQLLQFRTLEVGHQASLPTDAEVKFATSPQPIFHKNFDLVTNTFLDYQKRG